MQYEIDAKGFPVVWVESPRLWVHWLPVTKIHFERFLCDTGDARFDAAWYAELLKLNPRVAPGDVNADNYWQAFLSGILPQEAESFARWSGDGYRLPTDREWRDIYVALKEEPASGLPAGLPLDKLPARDTDLLKNLERATVGNPRGAQRMVVDLMLLSGGVIEWVEDRDNPHRWSGRGETPKAFQAALATAGDPDPSRPNAPSTRRLKQYGFRLVRAA